MDKYKPLKLKRVFAKRSNRCEICSFSMPKEMYGKIKAGAFALGISASAFIRGLFTAWEQCQKEQEEKETE